MSTKFTSIVALAFFAFTSCGGDSTRLEVVLSVNQTENALLQVSQDFEAGLSTGIYFIFDELEAVPASIDDTISGGDSFSEPNVTTSSVGLDPLKDEFKINSSSLKPASFYRVTMIAKDLTGAITHTGKGDCPVKVSLKELNTVKICFGKNVISNPPLCTGLTAFSDCPGI